MINKVIKELEHRESWHLQLSKMYQSEKNIAMEDGHNIASNCYNNALRIVKKHLDNDEV